MSLKSLFATYVHFGETVRYRVGLNTNSMITFKQNINEGAIRYEFPIIIHLLQLVADPGFSRGSANPKEYYSAKLS